MCRLLFRFFPFSYDGHCLYRYSIPKDAVLGKWNIRKQQKKPSQYVVINIRTKQHFRSIIQFFTSKCVINFESAKNYIRDFLKKLSLRKHKFMMHFYRFGFKLKGDFSSSHSTILVSFLKYLYIKV